MEDDLVKRFDDAHVVYGGVEVVMGERFELAAGEAGEAHGRQPLLVRPVDGLEDVGTVARARDGQQQVARRGEVLELLDEDPVVTLVVTPGQDCRRVVGQAEDFEPLLILEVAQGALGQILAQVRSVGARAAVAADEDETAGVVGCFDKLRHFLELGRIELFDFAADHGEVIRNAEFCTEHQYFTWIEGALVVGC